MLQLPPSSTPTKWAVSCSSAELCQDKLSVEKTRNRCLTIESSIAGAFSATTYERISLLTCIPISSEDNSFEYASSEYCTLHCQTSLAYLLVGGRVRTNKVVGGEGGSSQGGECLPTRTLDKFLLCLGDETGELSLAQPSSDPSCPRNM